MLHSLYIFVHKLQLPHHQDLGVLQLLYEIIVYCENSFFF